MSPDKLNPDTPKEWLNRTKSDLAISRAEIEGASLEDLCFHSQQCAEKAIKALLLYKIGHFPYIHDLSELVNQLQKAGIDVPSEISDTVDLTEYAVQARYPGFDEPVSEAERQEAVHKASTVLTWVKKMIISITVITMLYTRIIAL